MLQVILATFLLALPLRFWGLSLPEPVFALPVVYAWAVIRPSMLAPVGVMLMGFYLDLLWGNPLGFWAVCLLLPYGLVLKARLLAKAGESAPALELLRSAVQLARAALPPNQQAALAAGTAGDGGGGTGASSPAAAGSSRTPAAHKRSHKAGGGSSSKAMGPSDVWSPGAAPLVTHQV